MFLVLKIDEFWVMICNVNVCFVSIIEIWFKEYIEDIFVLILGYNIICFDRKDIDYGGVCMYVWDFICFRVLYDFMSDEFEVLWM